MPSPTPPSLAAQRERLAGEFRARHGLEPVLVRAPGRVNLIGEHTDYNDGFVMPAAIDFYTWAAAAPLNNIFVADSLQYEERLEVPAASEQKTTHRWTDYCWGVWQALRESGIWLPGAALLVDGDVPIGAGLSSSAAIEVATAFAICTLAESMPSKIKLAQICQRAENQFVGARCGIMDQFIACTGRAGSAVMLDCRSLDFAYVTIPSRISLLICNTMVKHSIAGGEYNQRRSECEEGVRLLQRHLPGIRALRDVSLADFERWSGELPDVIRRRCRHVVRENARVIAFQAALANGDLNTAGALMAESHASLRGDYEVSCPELDAMVDIAVAQPGVMGARMTGGGFGGCTVNLVQSSAVEQAAAAIKRAYRERTQLEAETYISVASEGVHQL